LRKRQEVRGGSRVIETEERTISTQKKEGENPGANTRQHFHRRIKKSKILIHAEGKGDLHGRNGAAAARLRERSSSFIRMERNNHAKRKSGLSQVKVKRGLGKGGQGTSLF